MGKNKRDLGEDGKEGDKIGWQRRIYVFAFIVLGAAKTVWVGGCFALMVFYFGRLLVS